MLTIDTDTGEIRFEGETLSLSPSLTREAFLQSKLAKRSQPASQIHNESFALPNVEIQGHPFYRVLYFLGGRLYQVFMGSAHPQYGQSWNDSTHEKEAHRKQFHDSLLAAIFGQARDGYEFPWGSVSCDCDNKSDFSQIAVTYVA